jgi:hypothetical protein
MNETERTEKMGPKGGRAHRRATAAADKLCAALGEGWTPRVWENVEWQHAAVSGGFEVVHPLPGVYMASCARWLERGRTAKGALRKCLVAVLDAIEEELA